MKIGLIGIGAIGSFLAKNLRDELVWVCDIDRELCEKRIRELKLKANYAQKPEQGADLVIEAASQQAVPLLIPALETSDILIMSVGALRDEKLLESLKAAAKRHGRKIYLPSGAIGGLDAIKSAKDGLREVTLETRKNPKTLGRNDATPTTIFEGNAAEACAKFPQSVNVSATLALAGIGFEKTKVRIVADPNTTRNTHTITAKGDSGDFSFSVANVPSKENPKTSALAMLAALRAVKEIEGGSVLRIM